MIAASSYIFTAGAVLLALSCTVYGQSCSTAPVYTVSGSNITCPSTAPYLCGTACFNSSQYTCSVNPSNFSASTLVPVAGAFNTGNSESGSSSSICAQIYQEGAQDASCIINGVEYCYNPACYTCNANLLCPTSAPNACSTSCYDPNEYSCSNGALQQIPNGKHVLTLPPQCPGSGSPLAGQASTQTVPVTTTVAVGNSVSGVTTSIPTNSGVTTTSTGSTGSSTGVTGSSGGSTGANTGTTTTGNTGSTGITTSNGGTTTTTTTSNGNGGTTPGTSSSNGGITTGTSGSTGSTVTTPASGSNVGTGVTPSATNQGTGGSGTTTGTGTGTLTVATTAAATQGAGTTVSGGGSTGKTAAATTQSSTTAVHTTPVFTTAASTTHVATTASTTAAATTMATNGSSASPCIVNVPPANYSAPEGVSAGPILLALNVELGCSGPLNPVVSPIATGLGGITFAPSVQPITTICAQSLLGAPAIAGNGFNGTSDLTYNGPNSATDSGLPPQFGGNALTGSFVAGSAINNGPQTGTCDGVYGDFPATVTNSVDGLSNSAQVCDLINQNYTGTNVGTVSTLMGYVDANGQQRVACFFNNSNSKPNGGELPLIVWLHPSLAQQSISFPATQWQYSALTEPLNNQDSSKIGFSYLLVIGRDTQHQYPFPDGDGVGWDNWYRNYDRCSPNLNVDVATIDYYLRQVVTTSPVDTNRIFFSGWSNGAAMAIQYSLLTPGIAATAVYSAPDAWRDAVNIEHCQQVPPIAYNTPILDLHNYCDIIGICTTGSYFNYDLLNRYNNLDAWFETIYPNETVVGITNPHQATAACDPTCSTSSGLTPGSLYHNRWPTQRNEDFFTFFRNRPLNQQPYPRVHLYSPQSSVSGAVLYGTSP